MEFIRDNAIIDQLFEFYVPLLRDYSRNPVTGAAYKTPKTHNGKAQLLNFFLYNPHVTFLWSDVLTYAHVNIWLEYIKASGYRFAICGPSLKGRTLEAAGLTDVPVFAWDEGFQPKAFLQTGRDMAAIFYTVNKSANSNFIATLPQYLQVHIHHGDSDKAGSFSRLDTLYDYLIVADANAVDRFRRANIAIPQERFLASGGTVFPGVLVGKRKRPPRRILYAPTFEGWSNATNFGSVMRAGAMVKRHVEDNPGEVVVRSHYASGARQPVYKERVKELVAMTKSKHRSKADQFNWSDVLLADVSGVLSEYLFTGKPIITPVCADDEWIMAHMKAHGLLKYVYTWDYKALSLADFLESIAGDPLRSAREKRRKRLYLGLTSFEESVRQFDDVIQTLVLRKKMRNVLTGAPYDAPAVPLPDVPALAELVGRIQAGTAMLRGPLDAQPPEALEIAAEGAETPPPG